MTPPGRRRAAPKNWVPNAAAIYRGLGALLPGLSSTLCYFYDDGVDTDIVA